MAALAFAFDIISGCVNSVFSYYTNVEDTSVKDSKEVVVPLIKCQRCSRNFGDHLIPQNLLCGHTLCTSCVGNSVSNNIPCPEHCEKKKNNKVVKPSVNYQLLRLTRSLANKEINLGTEKMTIISPDYTNFDSSQDVWKCNIHSSPNVLFCLSCNSWICENCLVLDHPSPPRGSCLAIQMSKAIAQIQTKYKEVAALILKDLETIKDNFELEFGIHDFCIKHCTKERSHLHIIKKLEPLLVGKKEENREEVETAKEQWKKLTDSFHAIDSPEEITTSCKELIDLRINSKTLMINEGERLAAPRPLMINHFRMEIKRLADGMKPLYTTSQENGRSMWGRVCIKDDRLLLYSMKQGKTPSDGITFPYKYLEMMMDEDSRTVFLEVESDGKAISGRVFIKLLYKNPLTDQMFLMCSGKKGVSYNDSRFFQRQKGSLTGGEYQNSNGTTASIIVEGLGEDDYPMYESESRVGLVVGEKHSTRFHIILREDNEYHEIVLGKVNQGLHLLKAASKLELVTKIHIKECGIFFPMNTSYEDSDD